MYNLKKIFVALFGVRLINYLIFVIQHRRLPGSGTFSYYVNYKKINYTEEMVRLSDKIRAKEALVEWGYSYLLPATYCEISDISKEAFDALPGSFVLKMNTGAGCNYICNDKKKVSFEELSSCVSLWEVDNVSWVGLEFHYSLIKPRLYAEEVIGGGDDELVDYKFHMFPSGFMIIAVYRGRGRDLRVDYFTRDLIRLPQLWNYKSSGLSIETVIPANINELIEVAMRLYELQSEEYVRIDLYSIEGKVIFGEFTFTHSGGYSKFVDPAYDKTLYRWGWGV
ncbi:ATP-grasp fold amidoligase family protein [Bacterioplanoides sp.]|uniref:ATP-grasp fold amidoligase family protein n=1 Tax=Bacterioplanoides sp. TaxID=2066072 RepID=UPI003B5BB485